METIVHLIEETSDQTSEIIPVTGFLVGADLGGTFHLSVPNGPDYRGTFANEFNLDAEMILGRTYEANIRVNRTLVYATEKESLSYELVFIREPKARKG